MQSLTLNIKKMSQNMTHSDNHGNIESYSGYSLLHILLIFLGFWHFGWLPSKTALRECALSTAEGGTKNLGEINPVYLVEFSDPPTDLLVPPLP